MGIQAFLHLRKMSSLVEKMRQGVDVSSFVVPISRSSIVNEIVNIGQAKKNLSQEQYRSVYALYKVYDNEKVEIQMTPPEYVMIYGSMIDSFQQLAPWEKYNGDGRPYISSASMEKVVQIQSHQNVNTNIKFLPDSVCDSKPIDISHVDLFLSASILRTYYTMLKKLGVCDLEYVKSYIVPKYDIEQTDFSCCRKSNCLFVNNFPTILSTETVICCSKIHFASLLLSSANSLVDHQKILDIAAYRALIVPTTEDALNNSEEEIRSEAYAKYQLIDADLNQFSSSLTLLMLDIIDDVKSKRITYNDALYKYYSYVANQCSIKNAQHLIFTCTCSLSEWREAALKNCLPTELSAWKKAIINVTDDSMRI